MQGAPVEGARVPPDSLHFMSWTVPKEALHGVRELSSPTQRTPSPALKVDCKTLQHDF